MVTMLLLEHQIRLKSSQHKSTCSPDVVCGRIVTKSLRSFDSQLKSSQESRRTPFDIRPPTPAEDKNTVLLIHEFELK